MGRLTPSKVLKTVMLRVVIVHQVSSPRLTIMQKKLEYKGFHFSHNMCFWYTIEYRWANKGNIERMQSLVSDRAKQRSASFVPEENGKKCPSAETARQDKKHRHPNKKGMMDAVRLAQRLKWKWGEHVIRMDCSRWTYASTCGTHALGKEAEDVQGEGGRTLSGERLERSGREHRGTGRHGKDWKGLRTLSELCIVVYYLYSYFCVC
ncbi:hypothetical protein ANN_26787 [Periplaneta americana]|uniref:Uncharacterized protein n=1 Tax=Periplaneta americana TaxID=6978 RepID=A0ABQ8RZ12_PERAM|nr:hypothetical protein ANN_26787 [Periplaneta americana]